MLVLPIKKKWFGMILSGEKKEEYREIKPYWTTRIMNDVGCKKKDDYSMLVFKDVVKVYKTIPINAMFRNGYSKSSPSFIAKCTLSVGTGKEEWGAEKDKQYFILTIHEIG